MPTYPTSQRRAPTPVSAPPTRPDIRVPVPDNDNPRHRIRTPANDNKRPPRVGAPSPNIPRVGKPSGKPSRLIRKLIKRLPLLGLPLLLDDVFTPSSNGAPVPVGGFQLVRGPLSYPFPYNTGVTGQWNGAAHLSGEGRIDGQAIVNVGVGAAVPANINTYSLWRESSEFAGRWAQSHAYRRLTADNPLGQPIMQPATMEGFPPDLAWVPSGFPHAFPPLSAPVGAPAVPPALVPIIAPLIPSPIRPDRGYDVDVEPRPISPPSHSRIPADGKELERKPDGSTVTKPVTQHSLRPPRSGERERKGKAKGVTAFRVIGGAFGALTEVNDAIGALHKALPPKYRARSFHKGRPVKPSWRKQWAAVYQNYDKIDLNTALVELIKNQIEDKIIGKLAKGANSGFTNPVEGINRFRRHRRPQIQPEENEKEN